MADLKKDGSRIRVHLIINYFGPDRGGAERLVWQLRRDLQEAGVDVKLIALEECRTDGSANEISLRGKGSRDPRILPRLAAYAKSDIDSGDVVHAHLFPASAYVAALVGLGIVQAPCVFTEHSTSNRRRNLQFGGQVDRSVYKAFRTIVAISEGVEQALLATYPTLSGKTEVIFNGCALPFEAPPAREAAPVAPMILSMGRLAGVKNHATALRALAGLGDRDFRYVVLGDGEERERLIGLAAALGLSERVTFAGHCSDVRPYLLDADMFLLPSLWEGFGLAAVEAMNAGLPVIASDVPGLREVVGESGQCGVLVDPNSVSAIRCAVSAMLDAPSWRAEMGGRGFLRASRFGKAPMTNAYIEMYVRLAKTATAHA